MRKSKKSRAAAEAEKKRMQRLAEGLPAGDEDSGRMEEEKGNADYEELINEKIAKAVLSRPVLHMDYDEFDAWLRDGQKKYMAKRRKRRIRFCSAAVCFCVCLGAAAVLPPLVGESSAARDRNMTVVEENGNIIIGGDGEAGIERSVAEYKSLDDIRPADKEKLILFEEIPEGYVLESVEIEKSYGIEQYLMKYISQFLYILQLLYFL